MGGRNFEVGVMERNSDYRSDYRVTSNENRNKEPVKPRGPTKSRRRVTGDVVKGVRIVRGLNQIETSFEGIPIRTEDSSRQRWRDRGRIFRAFNKIEVTTQKSRNGGVSRTHGFDETRVIGEVTTRFEVNIEQLKRRVGACAGRVTTQLNTPLGNEWKRDVRGRITSCDCRSVDNESPTVRHIQIVARNDTVRKTSKSMRLSGGQVSLLKANDIVRLDKVTKSTRNLKSTRESRRVCGVVRKTVNVVSENGRDRKRRRRNRRWKRGTRRRKRRNRIGREGERKVRRKRMRERWERRRERRKNREKKEEIGRLRIMRGVCVQWERFNRKVGGREWGLSLDRSGRGGPTFDPVLTIETKFVAARPFVLSRCSRTNRGRVYRSFRLIFPLARFTVWFKKGCNRCGCLRE